MRWYVGVHNIQIQWVSITSINFCNIFFIWDKSLKNNSHEKECLHLIEGHFLKLSDTGNEYRVLDPEGVKRESELSPIYATPHKDHKKQVIYIYANEIR